MSGMLQIARALELDTGLSLYEPIMHDLSNYSYPFIAIQRKQPLGVFARYCADGQIGLWTIPYVLCLCLSLLILGNSTYHGK